MIKVSRMIVTVAALALAACICAQTTPQLPPQSEGDVRIDQLTLADAFESLGGATHWPPAWRAGWNPSHNATWITLCDRSGWHAAQCEGHTHRLFKWYHRSGHATGTLPSNIGNLRALEILDLSENHIKGTIPESVGLLRSLRSLALSGNELEGTIPASIARLSELRFLHLSRNKLRGTIPAFLGNLTNLEVLFLDGNKFTGTIPPELSKLTKLRHIRLDDNDLDGEIPLNFLVNATNIVAIELAGNAHLTLPTSRSDSTAWQVPETFERAHFVTFGLGKSPPTLLGADGGVSAPLRFMSVGDHGTGGAWLGSWHELASAFHFNRFASWLDAAFTTSVGDNLYLSRGQNEADFFHESFEVLFTAPPLLSRPWYATIGNHDRVTPQLEYAQRSKRFRMPSLEFNVKGIPVPHRDGSVSNATLDLFFHDSVTRAGRAGMPNVVALQQAVENSTATYRVIVTHYPQFSGGCHKKEKGAAAFTGVVQSGNITAVLAGHDHHSEVVVDTVGAFHIMTGAFARGPCRSHDVDGSLWHDNTQAGFSYVTVDPYIMNVTFVSEHGAMMYVASIPFNWTRAPPEVRRKRVAPTRDELRNYNRLNRFPAWQPPSIKETSASPPNRNDGEASTPTSTVLLGVDAEKTAADPRATWTSDWITTARVNRISNAMLFLVPLFIIVAYAIDTVTIEWDLTEQQDAEGGEAAHRTEAVVATPVNHSTVPVGVLE